jgi:hypothetical protein
LSQMPPDINVPYFTEEDRENAREAVLLYFRLIEVLARLADQTSRPWSPDQVALFPAGLSENPSRRLARWLTTFGDEIKIIRDVRNQIVRVGVITDLDLKGAEFLARQIISTLFDMQPSQVNPTWARKALARVGQEVVLLCLIPSS